MKSASDYYWFNPQFVYNPSNINTRWYQKIPARGQSQSCKMPTTVAPTKRMAMAGLQSSAKRRPGLDAVERPAETRGTMKGRRVCPQ